MDEDPAFISQLVKILVTPELVTLPGYEPNSPAQAKDGAPCSDTTKATASDQAKPTADDSGSSEDLIGLLRKKTKEEIETICNNISALPRKLSNAVVSTFFNREKLKQFLEEAPKIVEEDPENKRLPFAMLLSLPFATHSSMMKNLAKSYAKTEWAESLPLSLTYALVSGDGSVESKVIKQKNYYLCTLCHVIEAEHLLTMNVPVPDRYDLVYPCLQILQCPKATSLMKQFSVRICHMELENGIRARHNLMDYYTVSIISDLIPSTCKPPTYGLKDLEKGGTLGVCYDDSQWLIIYLLRFLYRAFDFEHLWDDPEITNNGKSGPQDFEESLSLRCANLVSHASTLEVRAAAKLILTYPMNWQALTCHDREKTGRNKPRRTIQTRKRVKKIPRPQWKTAFPAMVKEMHRLQNRFLMTNQQSSAS